MVILLKILNSIFWGLRGEDRGDHTELKFFWFSFTLRISGVSCTTVTFPLLFCRSDWYWSCVKGKWQMLTLQIPSQFSSKMTKLWGIFISYHAEVLLILSDPLHFWCVSHRHIVGHVLLCIFLVFFLMEKPKWIKTENTKAARNKLELLILE